MTVIHQEDLARLQRQRHPEARTRKLTQALLASCLAATLFTPSAFISAGPQMPASSSRAVRSRRHVPDPTARAAGEEGGGLQQILGMKGAADSSEEPLWKIRLQL
mmetsp:Transcript_34679/g.80953  ORF Transcript_34679/g.80953 Transcript_34679/m.80953 type:complete len:105 (+) Transcript_34679:78-392(+)